MATEPLQGKTALITGAARRIGRATALALAAEGANVVIHYDRSAGPAASLQEELTGLGVQAWTLQAGFRRPEEYESLVDQALEAAGRLDLLVNNASMFPPDRLEDLELPNVMANMEVNAWAPFVLGRAFAGRVGRGQIINLLDSRLVGYEWTHVSYILSKHVLAALTNMMALQYAPGITVNAIGPGLILPPPGKDDSYLDQMTKTVPLKRHGDPTDVAEAIVYLAKSTFLTGQVIYVDGGRHLWEYVSGPHPD